MGQMDLMDLRSTHSPKTNMEPENQLFEKETHLPNISKPSFAISVLVFGGSSQVLVDCPDWKDSLFLVARPSIPPVTKPGETYLNAPWRDVDIDREKGFFSRELLEEQEHLNADYDRLWPLWGKPQVVMEYCSDTVYRAP